MVYKLEVGMEIEYSRKDENGNVIKQIFIIKNIPKDITDKVLVVDKENNKKKKLSRDILKYCKRHNKEKVKKDSAIKIAIKVLKKENRPIHIDELIRLIFKEGYKLPRGGRTFKNTISTSLNNECLKRKPKIKKIDSAIYATINYMD